MALHLRAVYIEYQWQPRLRHTEFIDRTKACLRVKMLFELLQEHGAVRLSHVHQVLKHARKLLYVLFLLLHIQIIARKL